jgi:cytoskeletal protein CcmA (bactofilin family)
MFEKSKKPYTDLLGKTNRIVEGTAIKGNIQSSADFRLDGQLVGDFQSTGKLVVGPTGSVLGNIVCENCDIEGKFEGKIQVSETLTLKEGAYVKGEVICGKLSVEQGAIFNATCNMSSEKTTQTKNAKEQSEK